MKHQKTDQEILIQKLKHLKPDAVINVRPHDSNEHLVANPVVVGDFLVDWDDSQGQCPSMQELDAVDMAAMEAAEEERKRNAIVEQLRSDYQMQAAFNAYAQAGGEMTKDEFIRNAVDTVEDAR